MVHHHSLVFMTRKAGYLRNGNHKTTETRYLKFLNQADFLADFNKVDWEGMTTLLCSGNIGRKISCPLLINNHAPLRRKRSKGKKSPWITYNLLRCMRKRFPKTHPVTWLKFNKTRNDVNNFKRVAKRKYKSENLNA